MNGKIFFLILMAVLMGGCVSNYRGPEPDFSRTGLAAEREVRDFSLSRDFWTGVDAYAMGSEDRRYWLSSLAPVIRVVSPEAMQKVQRTRVWRAVQWVILGGAVAVLIVKTDGSKWDTGTTLAYYGALGGAIGIGIYRQALADDTMNLYNRDLQRRFQPGVAVTASF